MQVPVWLETALGAPVKYFGKNGTPEDPVSGSAHCTLGPYWGAKWGKTVMTGLPGVATWREAARVELKGDRVHWGGRALTVAKIEPTHTDQ